MKNGMLEAAVLCDNWKTKTFKKHLDEAGFEYKVHAGPVPNTATIKVLTKTAAELQPVVQAAYDECKRMKQN